jgi:hypothetical protein
MLKSFFRNPRLQVESLEGRDMPSTLAMEWPPPPVQSHVSIMAQPMTTSAEIPSQLGKVDQLAMTINLAHVGEEIPQ